MNNKNGNITIMKWNVRLYQVLLICFFLSGCTSRVSSPESKGGDKNQSVTGSENGAGYGGNRIISLRPLVPYSFIEALGPITNLIIQGASPTLVINYTNYTITAPVGDVAADRSFSMSYLLDGVLHQEEVRLVVGDLNGDGLVNYVDAEIFRNCWFSTELACAGLDYDFDGDIDMTDFVQYWLAYNNNRL